jgi:hypothetical protein
MYYLIYISTAVKLLTEEELRSILIASRKKNTAKNITGLLLYSEGVFIELLEGDKMEVILAYKKIEIDRDHKNLIILSTGESTGRIFPDWSMGYMADNKTAVQKMSGYVNPSALNQFEADSENPAIVALKTFIDDHHL